jgi:hypothetical protein
MLRKLSCLFLLGSAVVMADGGSIILRRSTSRFDATVFAAPLPLRAGPVDLSILLQTTDGAEPVLDADVDVVFTRGNSQIRAQATRNKTGNKLLYNCEVHLDEPGVWQYTMSVEAGVSAPVILAGTLDVAPKEAPLSAYRGYLALPFLWMGIFFLHQWLKAKKGTNRSQGDGMLLDINNEDDHLDNLPVFQRQCNPVAAGTEPDAASQEPRQC